VNAFRHGPNHKHIPPRSMTIDGSLPLSLPIHAGDRDYSNNNFDTVRRIVDHALKLVRLLGPVPKLEPVCG